MKIIIVMLFIQILMDIILYLWNMWELNKKKIC